MNVNEGERPNLSQSGNMTTSGPKTENCSKIVHHWSSENCLQPKFISSLKCKTFCQCLSLKEISFLSVACSDGSWCLSKNVRLDFIQLSSISQMILPFIFFSLCFQHQAQNQIAMCLSLRYTLQWWRPMYSLVGSYFIVLCLVIPILWAENEKGIKDNMEYLQYDYILTWTAYEPLILCLSCNK